MVGRYGTCFGLVLSLIYAVSSGPPQVSQPSQRQQMTVVGRTLRLACPVTADPPPLLQWTKDTETIHRGWERFQVQSQGLRIKDVQLDDGGNYVCKATNGFGHVTIQYMLYVLASEWGYSRNNGPPAWPSLGYAICAGHSQSPIDLVLDATTYSDTYQNLDLIKYNTTSGATYTLKNTGHSVQVDVSGLDAMISGAGLNGPYDLDQFHFHWGNYNTTGSEHRQDGLQYPMEIHFVHHSANYANLSSALPLVDGVAVIGVFVEIGPVNAALTKIIDSMGDIEFDGNSIDITAFNLNGLLPADNQSYYRYQGSLTTPDCYESVQWINMKTPITASTAQLNAFRTLLKTNAAGATINETLVDNFRPVQPLNGRTVYRSFDECLHCFRTHGNWGYHEDENGPDTWADIYPIACGGTKQSPIDVVHDATMYDVGVRGITFTGYDATTGFSLILKNNGHSVQVNVSGLSGTNGELTQGGLTKTYRLEQFHFHWGQYDTIGSEHRLNGRQYPMEMHLVHYDTTYDSVAEAASHDEGLAVVAVFVQVEGNDNAAFSQIVNNLPNIKYEDDDTSIPTFAISSLLPSDVTQYYRYDGSLTTPSCNEGVVWTVMANPIKISENQIEKFRTQVFEYMDEEGDSKGHNIYNNFRRVQPLNGRQVARSFAPDESNVGRHANWGYGKSDGPAVWPTLGYATCGGSSQSPIDIVHAACTYGKTGLTFTDYSTTGGVTMQLQNNGHSVQVNVGGGKSTLSGSDLDTTYTLTQFHFHWGQYDTIGSEHRLNGRQYPMEVHMVHANDDGDLAVIGILVEISSSDNPAFQPIIDKLNQVEYEGDDVDLTVFAVSKFFPSDVESYYRYTGSLTTPGCNEDVTWTVMNKTITISLSQIDHFRSGVKAYENVNGTYSREDLVNNFRPVQPINGRVVFKSFDEDTDDRCVGLAPVLSKISFSSLVGLLLFLRVFI